MIGKIVSTKMKNTVVVEIERLMVHPVYKKRLRRTSRFLADDQLGAKEGDRVRLQSTRPVSAKKQHKVIEILSSERAVKGKNGTKS